MHEPKEYKDEAIQPNLEFAKLKRKLSQVPEFEKVVEHGHVLPSCSSPDGSKRIQTGPQGPFKPRLSSSATLL